MAIGTVRIFKLGRLPKNDQIKQAILFCPMKKKTEKHDIYYIFVLLEIHQKLKKHAHNSETLHHRPIVLSIVELINYLHYLNMQ